MTQPSETADANRLGPVPDRPIRVVLLGGGPYLEQGVREFLCMLEQELEVDLRGIICQSQSQSMAEVVRDLWRRRRWLAAPLFLAQAGRVGLRAARAPRRELALQKGLRSLSNRIRFVPDIHAPEVLRHIESLDSDLGLVYGSPILKEELFHIPRFGSIGIHHGKMPEYRGKKTTFWEMARGEATAGVTIQRIGSGLDTGAIVKQGSVPIANHSYGRVWREVERLGLELYMAAVLEIKRGRATLSPLCGKKGRLCRDPKLADLLALQRQRWSGRR